MSKTFDALKKAEKDNLIIAENDKSFISKLSFKSKNLSRLKLTTRMAEEYRSMKQTILANSTKEKIQAILFSSSASGEGTSTVLVNFAIETAKSGDKVIIVDSNLRKPSLHDLLNVEKKGGLTEVLTNKCPLIQVIKKTSFNNLFIISSGLPLSNPFPGFISDALDPLIKEMKTMFDWILFDSPPIHAFNDANTMAAKMDGVIMVVQAEKTKWEVAQSAKERILQDNTKLLGAVLNKKQMYIPNWLYKRI